VHPYPTVVRDLVLLSIAVGAIAANAINIYSGAISFTALGFKIPLRQRRALIAGVFGIAGFIVAAIGLNNIDEYEDFLLIIAYWIGPWLAVVFVDRMINKGDHGAILFDSKYTNWAGPIAMAVGMAISIPLFSNQLKFVAWVPKHHPKFGDLTFEVGFVVAAIVYFVLAKTALGPNKKAAAPA
jgi:NCS1 family nucleobase:cation symporter-1